MLHKRSSLIATVETPIVDTLKRGIRNKLFAYCIFRTYPRLVLPYNSCMIGKQPIALMCVTVLPDTLAKANLVN